MDFKAHPKHEYVVHGPGPQVQPQAKPRRACQIVVHYSTRESPQKNQKNLLLEPSWLRRSPRNPTTASHLTGRENRRNRRDSPGTNRAEKSRVRAASKRRGERGGECGGSGRRTARRRRGRGRRSPSTSTSSPSSASPRWESPRPRLVSSLLLRFLRRDLFFFLWHVCS